MTEQVNRRKYDATKRRESADQTRQAVLRAARFLFTTRGYNQTSVADIARHAGVSVDTLYATVGRKPQLLIAVHDMALAQGDEPVAAEDRDYVRRIRAASSVIDKITIYAEALARLLPETVPLLQSLQEAAHTDPLCAETYAAVSERRAANMSRFAADLRSTGELRQDLDQDAVADLLWSMNSPEYYLLIRARGRTPVQYAEFVRDVWLHSLLPQPPSRGSPHLVTRSPDG